MLRNPLSNFLIGSSGSGRFGERGKGKSSTKKAKDTFTFFKREKGCCNCYRHTHIHFPVWNLSRNGIVCDLKCSTSQQPNTQAPTPPPIMCFQKIMFRACKTQIPVLLRQFKSFGMCVWMYWYLWLNVLYLSKAFRKADFNHKHPTCLL